MTFAANFQGITFVAHKFSALTVLFYNHLPIWFAMLLNIGGPFLTIFKCKHTLKKRYCTVDELVSLLVEFPNLHLTILLGLVLIGNEFSALQDL